MFSANWIRRRSQKLLSDMTLVAPELKEQGKAREGDHEGRGRHYIKRTFQGSLAVTYWASKCFKKYKHEAIKEP